METYCIKCGNKLTNTGDDFINAICSKCKNKEVPPILYGWICPRCGMVHSPFSIHCDCPPVILTSTKDTTLPNN